MSNEGSKSEKMSTIINELQKTIHEIDKKIDDINSQNYEAYETKSKQIAAMHANAKELLGFDMHLSTIYLKTYSDLEELYPILKFEENEKKVFQDYHLLRKKLAQAIESLENNYNPLTSQYLNELTLFSRNDKLQLQANEQKNNYRYNCVCSMM